MNKKVTWIFAVIVTACALSAGVIAQPPGGGPRGPGMGGGPGDIFRNPEFVKILELTSAQSDEIQKIMQTSMEEFRAEMQRNPGTPPNPDEMRKRFEGAQQKVMEVMKPAQQTKARELTFQLTGGLDSPMLNERTLETLELTAEQKEKIRKLSADRDAEFRTVMQGFDWRNATPEQRQKFGTDNAERTKKYRDQISAILTPEQKGKAEKLSAEAPALREKLGMPAPGQMGQGQRRGQGPPSGDGQPYTPGAGSWRPGQGVPGGDASPQPRTRQRSGFSRGESNDESE